MKAVAAYIASKSLQRGGDDRRNDYGGYENRQYSGNQRQPNQYSTRNGMDEPWPRRPGMERGGDSGSRMTYEDNGPESRYRGRDGRWKAGRRRSELTGDEYDNDPSGRRMGDDYDEDDDMQSNVIPWPYTPGMPHMPPESRMIGFGNSPREYETRSHYDGGRQEAEVGGTMWMEPKNNHAADDGKMDKQAMEKWVNHMRDDKDKQIEPWSTEEIKPLATRFGYPTNGEKFDNFYTAIHMMKSDFCAVAEEFDVDVPAFYAALADAWLKDPDAALHNREKLEAYHKYIVKGKK